MYRKSLIFCAAFISTLAISNKSFSQESEVRTITTAVPVLTLAPDARSAALGDAGVAISPDANSPRWNPGKMGFIQNDYGFAISYSPWLRNVVNDMGLMYLSGYKKLGPNSTFSASLLYFDLGEIDFKDASGMDMGKFSPKEYTVDLAYGQRLTDYLGLGIGARYIRSNLTGGASVGTRESRPANSAAVDLGIYYNRDVTIGAQSYNLAFGGAVTNLGGKISYTDPEVKDFLPTNLRLGTAITMDLDAFNKLTFIVDANKLLVPSPQLDSTGRATNLPNSDTGIFDAVFSSFNDAPGGSKEEFREVNLSLGLEYWYNEIFAVRGGYFYEHPTKGDRQFFSIGAGLKYQKAGLDVAYLIPRQQNNPLANTLRFTLSFNFDKVEDDTTPIE